MKGRFGLLEKTRAVEYAVSRVENKSFFLDSIGSCYEQGYNYLFWYYKHPPAYTKDLIFDPLLVGQKEERPTQIGVVIAAHSDKNKLEFYKEHAEYKKRAIDKKTFENIEVLIVKY